MRIIFEDGNWIVCEVSHNRASVMILENWDNISINIWIITINGNKKVKNLIVLVVDKWTLDRML